MQLSETTLKILDNFASINGNALLPQEGPMLTAAVNNAVAAQATLEEDFPYEFGIFDLKNFLACISLVGENPTIDWTDDGFKAVISGESGSVSYAAAEKSVLHLLNPDKVNSSKPPEPDLVFDFKQETMSQLKKAAATLSTAKTVKFTKGDQGLKAFIYDPEAPGSTSFSLDIESPDRIPDNDFEMHLSIKSFMLLSGNYKVRTSMAHRIMAVFEHDTLSVKYWIPMLNTSKAG